MKGIYLRDNSIQIYFNWNGKPQRETLTGSDGKPLPPTPKNATYAEKVREQILRAIAAGTFEFEEFFPHSRSSRGQTTKRSNKIVCIREAVERFLLSKSKDVDVTSLRAYRSTIKYFVAEFGGRLPDEVPFHDLDRHMSGIAEKFAATTYNATLTLIYSFYEYAILCKWATSNPSKNIKQQDRPDPKPDPLTPHERARVIADMEEHCPPGVWNYFELAFLIGFRPSEGIDLRWDNVNWDYGTIRIDSARVWGIQKETTKTGKARDVELGERGLEVLRRQFLITGDRKHGRIFESHFSNKPWCSVQKLKTNYWDKSLARCEIRARDARQTRHTCATGLLMAGNNPEWAARQLGHSPEMFRRVYSKWIEDVDQGRERRKFEAFLARFSSEQGQTSP